MIPAVRYDIIVEKANVKKYYYKDIDTFKLQGQLLWKLYKVEGSSRTEITTNNATSLNVSSYIKYGNTSKNAGWSLVDDCWFNQILPVAWDDSYSCVQIILKEGDIPVASIVVPVIMEAKDGKDAEQLQTLNGAVMRLTVWQANPTHPYNNGTVAEGGIYYLDVVQYGNELFKCVDPHNPTSNDSHPLSEGFSSKWSKVETMSDAAFHTMLVNDAYIKNLTAEQIVVTGKDGSSYANKPVAGVVNSEYLKQVSEEGSGIPTDNGVRIFAGPIPENGNLAGTAFNVDQEGNVKAGKGKIQLNSNGSGYVASGKISWDSNSNITAFGVNPFIGGSTQLVNQAYKNMLYVTRILMLGSL